MSRLACLLLLSALAACQRAPGELRIADGWIREAPADGPMAGYLRLDNGLAEAVRCDGAASPDFGAIEIHRSAVEDGMSRMLRDQVVEAPAGGHALLQPGGYHLMLFRAQRPLRAGDRATITLHCGAHQPRAEFTVRAQP
ncbi:copper chaperone PCu(A)C [Solimonas sp. K1W22B-7]|uniref:copper chaperone PCu(A)C n=1 Tax=Solimonas sp. K1W22B-7 TaxID=2303331 RepID=UPI000E330D0E|nr:copper chaperone PCu(A)C [Solimonas sp. K1W22B-7]AXQ29486.1 copper chaperone PCu(A)C [Solimonas sp. K1W22B-7]